MEYLNKDFANTKERIDFLVKNKLSIISQKKAVMKKADAFSFAVPIYDKKSQEYKANEPIKDINSLDSIKTKVVINTTNVIDSHMDLHIKGIWNKSLREAKNIMHLQEHQMKFDSIISDGNDLKAYAKEFEWSELGYNFEGNTQALVFESNIKADRNKSMFDQYAKGYVKNHSVGMQYVKLLLAVNDEDYKEEFDNWNKYIDLAINKEQAEEYGFFWVVPEAKVIEGSAVPIGSNQLTPTMENNMEPGNKSTPNNIEPSKDTQVLSKLNELLTKI